MLTILESIPEGLLDLDATRLHEKLSGPTLIHLRGQRQPAMFVSVLLHGNEHTSWEAVRRLLEAYENAALPRDVSVFIGNVEAAKHNLRFVDGQEDFNRIWGSQTETAHPIMQQVMDEMQARGIFFSIDVHNNTGHNPHYACVNKIDPRFIHLASLFSKSIVYFLKPEGVQSLAFAQFCPSVTVECGLSGVDSGTQHVVEFLRACIAIERFPESAPDYEALGVYHTVAVAKIPEQFSLGIEDPSCDISLDDNIESYNFAKMPRGTMLGHANRDISTPIFVSSEDGGDVSDQFITIEGDKIVLKRSVIPAMFTLDVTTIKKDCLCYFMEEYPISQV